MNLVIVGHFQFPTGSAAASRMRHFAKGFVERGHRVWAITMAPTQSVPERLTDDHWAEWSGVRHRPAGSWANAPAARNPVGRIVQILGGMRRDGRLACGLLERLHREAAIDLVIGYSAYQLGMQPVLSLCRRLGIPFVSDVVEWLGPDSFAMGRVNPLYWDTERAFRFFLPRTDGIIAISSFLQRWFSDKGLPTLRVPAVIDPGDSPPPGTPAPTQSFTLTYLGNMIDRDGPMLMIDAVRRVIAEGHDIVFNVVGGTERVPAAQRAKAAAEADPQLRGRVTFWGRVSDEAVQRHLRESDALVFTRLSGRPSEAAFPTRLPEYLTAGTPVIASRVSDIAEYLKDGRDAIVVAPDSPAALAEGIIRLARLPDRGRAIGLAGRERCAECFHYGMHVDRMLEFFEREILPRQTAPASAR